MAESSIPVDLLNPGQVFACLGILEAADTLLGDAKAAFDWSTGNKAAFRVSAAGSEPPMKRVMQFLEDARIVTRAPENSATVSKWNSTWGDPPRVDRRGEPFPFPEPDSPAKLPVVLREKDGYELTIDYWGDATRRDNVKFWAGSSGYPGAALLRDALGLVRGKLRQSASQPFSLSAEQSSSFRFDWRRDYIPIHEGFSPNKHNKGNIRMVGYPLVEVLAAIGMSHARPCRKTKLEYKYAVLGCHENMLLGPVFHRAALGAKESPVPGWPLRRFIMRLDWPGQESRARCITQVTEETTNQ